MRALIHFGFAAFMLGLAGPAMASTGTVTVSPDGHRAMAPEMAVSADGSINLIWIERTPEGERIHEAGAASAEGHTHLAETDLWFSRSTDDGKTFSTPLRVNAREGAVWGFAISKPRIRTTADGTVHIFYPGNDVDGKSGKPVVQPMYLRSLDQGKSFGAARALAAIPDSDHSDIIRGGVANAQCFGTLVADDAGGVHAYWVDTRDMGADSPHGKIFSAVSTDNGESFGADFEVFPADVCPCCQLTATIADDKIYIGSRQVDADGNRDSVVAVSADGGKSFQPRVRWGGAHWQIEGCPLKPTELLVNGDRIYTVSFNGAADPQGVYLSRSLDGGKSFEAAIALHPQAAVSDAPAMALVGDRLVVVWHAKLGAERQVFYAVSADQGKSFGEPVRLGSGMYPVVSPRAGGLQFAWQQDSVVVTRFVTLDTGQSH